MLKTKLHHFYDLIEDAIGLYGPVVPVVTNAIIERAFPETFETAEREGCNTMLHGGVKAAVSRYIRNRPATDDQPGFEDICGAFRDYISELKSSAYTVPSRGEAVSVSALIAEPDLLDEARKYMRQKGLECMAEAKRLDDLYLAVTSFASSS